MTDKERIALSTEMMYAWLLAVAEVNTEYADLLPGVYGILNLRLKEAGLPMLDDAVQKFFTFTYPMSTS